MYIQSITPKNTIYKQLTYTIWQPNAKTAELSRCQMFYFNNIHEVRIDKYRMRVLARQNMYECILVSWKKIFKHLINRKPQ